MTGERLATLVAVFAALLAAAVSIFVGVSTVASSERSASQTAFIGAIQSLGGTTATDRASGAVLARSIVHEELAAADSPPLIYVATGQVGSMREQATANFRSALRAMEVTLKLGPPSTTVQAQSPASTSPIDCKGSRPGPEVTYLADEFVTLVDNQDYYDDIVEGTASGNAPAIDLSRVNLCGQFLEGLDLTRLSAAYFRKTNLRFADLTQTHLDGATFLGVDFTGAMFSGATARDTDFTCSTGLDTVNFAGVDVNGAVFTSTKITKSQLQRARGIPKLLPQPGDPRCQ